MRRSSIKCQKLKTLKKWYKNFLLGATKIEDLAGELKNSTFFSVAPPSLILCANQGSIGIDGSRVGGTMLRGEGLRVFFVFLFSRFSVDFSVCLSVTTLDIFFTFPPAGPQTKGLVKSLDFPTQLASFFKNPKPSSLNSQPQSLNPQPSSLIFQNSGIQKISITYEVVLSRYFQRTPSTSRSSRTQLNVRVACQLGNLLLRGNIPYSHGFDVRGGMVSSCKIRIVIQFIHIHHSKK